MANGNGSLLPQVLSFFSLTGWLDCNPARKASSSFQATSGCFMNHSEGIANINKYESISQPLMYVKYLENMTKRPRLAKAKRFNKTEKTVKDCKRL